VQVLRAEKVVSVIYMNSVFLLRQVIHELGARGSKRYDRGGILEVHVGIRVMNSSCASVSCHLIPSIALPGITYSGL